MTARRLSTVPVTVELLERVGLDLGWMPHFRDARIPIIPAIDAQIVAAINAGGTLDMTWWHRCETTHCRAGWAITLAGEAGESLEELTDPQIAGGLIYAASRPDKPLPDFFSSDAEAMADLRACAAEPGCTP